MLFKNVSVLDLLSYGIKGKFCLLLVVKIGKASHCDNKPPKSQ